MREWILVYRQYVVGMQYQSDMILVLVLLSDYSLANIATEMAEAR